MYSSVCICLTQRRPGHSCLSECRLGSVSFSHTHIRTRQHLMGFYGEGLSERSALLFIYEHFCMILKALSSLDLIGHGQPFTRVSAMTPALPFTAFKPEALFSVQGDKESTIHLFVFQISKSNYK